MKAFDLADKLIEKTNIVDLQSILTDKKSLPHI